MDIVLALIGLIAALLVALKADRLLRRPRGDLGDIGILAEETLMARDIANYRKQREEEEQERLREENIRNAAPPIPWHRLEKRPPFVLPHAAPGSAVPTPWAGSPSAGGRRASAAAPSNTPPSNPDN